MMDLQSCHGMMTHLSLLGKKTAAATSLLQQKPPITQSRVLLNWNKLCKLWSEEEQTELGDIAQPQSNLHWLP